MTDSNQIAATEVGNLLANWPSTLSILLWSVLFPAAIVVVRNNVKAKRQGIIRDLEKIFHRNEISDAIIPSFEFVKYKYFMNETGPDKNESFGTLWYIMSLILFISISFCGFFLISSAFSPSARGPFAPSLFTVGGFNLNEDGTMNSSTLSYHWNTLTIVGFAFMGAYLFCARHFLRAISNFDLSPLTFFRASVHILLACITSIVIWRSAPEFDFVRSFADMQSQNTGNSLLPGWFIVSFLIGYFPDLGLRNLMRSTRLKFIKRYSESAMEKAQIIPIEIIDGIDNEIRYRLEDFNIYDVQNLATANPIMLFVETPFGIYQTIDWVAQAQLACVVGPEKFSKLKDRNIRTIFDLELAGGFAATPATASLLSDIILPEGSPSSYSPERGLSQLDRTALTQELVQIIIDDLHVKRLRQLWNVIHKQLGDNDIAPRLRREDFVVVATNDGHRAAAE